MAERGRMRELKRVMIIGMGNLGALGGEKLTAYLGKENVIFLADGERVKRYNGQGFTINGVKQDFNVRSWEEELPPAADLMILTVKGTQLDEAIREARPHVGPDTVLLGLQNGISSEERLIEAFGNRHVLYGIAQGMDATRDGNVIWYEHPGEWRIGIPKGEDWKQEDLDAAAALFKAAGQGCTVEDDIITRIWSKWMMNVGINQVMMVSEGTYRTIQEPGKWRDMMIAAMEEVRKIAEAEHIPLTKEDLKNYVALLDSLAPDGMCSMRQDGLAKRPSEVDFFAGTVVRKAKAHGIKVPVNEELLKMIRGIEAGYPARS